ncbi:dentin sialophosphoprotein-like [Dorcoceras hygrometricum]|uniref:Dentin sialophosphoprotein-like n=1 Tax=Dorcoceras hygrometricum TaxID=472368 RepID=A0A2Z7BNI2_9LAMI|nr:dentin sialophosphoprotein-like [Dorcoceras hygrometricum]
MKRRRAEESADGLALMTSLVTSSYSADGLREQSQESADSVGKLCVDNQSQDPVASYSGSRRKQQEHPVESFYESAVAMNIVASSTHPVASFGIKTQEKKKQAKCRNSTSRELQYPVAGNIDARYPVVVMNQQRSS